MTREELRDQMKASREIYRFDYGVQSWKDAAKMYKEKTGSHFDPDCTGCRQRLLDWLLKE